MKRYGRGVALLGAVPPPGRAAVALAAPAVKECLVRSS